jgi:acyl carrier protein
MPSDITFSSAQKTAADVLIGALTAIGLDSSEISMEVSLADLDVNSLDIVEIIEIIRDKLDIELQGQDVLTCTTLQDVADLITREASAVRS